MPKFLLLLIFLSGALTALPMAAAEKAAGPDPYSDRELGTIAKMVSRVFSGYHYRKQPLDDKVSALMFDEYLKTLDPNRNYFTEQDVKDFSSERVDLDDQLRRGELSFAFRVYDVFKKRIAENRAFAEALLKKPFDFTLEEDYTPDRTKAPWAKNREELELLWTRKLKNDVLYYRLSDRARAEELTKAEKKGDKEAREEAVKRAKWEGKTPEEKVLRRLRDVGNSVEQRDRIDIVGLYLNSLAKVYGPHSNYLAPKVDEDFEINMRLSLTGIGATLTSDDGYIKVVELVPGGPADLDGRLKVEDRIIAVAQEGEEAVDVVDMPVSKAVQMIRGPENTKVALTVLPGEKGRNGIPKNILIKRAKVQLVESEAKGEVREVPRPGGGKALKIGVIDLPSFYMDFDAAYRGDENYKSCSRDVKKILEKFTREGVDGVVFDLRRNGGGSFPEAIAMVGLFVETAPVVQLRQSSGSPSLKSDEDPSVSWRGPLVVLTSKLSASSSEIFTAAIRDLDRGLVVGDSRTFGKGTVLNVVPLDRFVRFAGRKFQAGSITHESAMFYRVPGGSVQQLGVESDIVLPSLTEPMEIGEMFMDYHLPWDSIPSAKFSLWDKTLPGRIAELKSHSAARIAVDPEYRKLLKQIDIFKRHKDKKTLSLNENRRWKEYQDEKQLYEAEKVLDDEDSSMDRKKKKTLPDPVLKEAVNITADLIAGVGIPHPVAVPATETARRDH